MVQKAVKLLCFSGQQFTKINRKSVLSLILFTVIITISLCSYFPFFPAFASVVKADKIIVIKSKRLMLLMNNAEILKAYRISLGKHPVGHKTRKGDEKTPEGIYVIDSRITDSKFYLALHISYPNDSDIKNAQGLGVDPGGDIVIHGLPNGLGKKIGKLHRLTDWTDGCIAVTNSEMVEIWQLVPDGTTIEIKP
jgi:murein L,D-transpeptidase YafK